MKKIVILFLVLSTPHISGCASFFRPPPQPTGPAAPALKEARKGLQEAQLGRQEKSLRHFSTSLQNPHLSNHQKAAILNNRGVVHKNVGDYALAEADFSQAILLDAERLNRAWYNRAIVRFFMGKDAASIQDFDRFIQKQPAPLSPYPYLWRYVAQRRLGMDAHHALEKEADRLEKTIWPGPVVSFFLTGKKGDRLPSEATVPDSQQTKENLCDAFFFLGEQALLSGQKQEAMAWFDKAIETDMTHLNEHIGAQIEKQRLTRKAIPTDHP